MGIFRWSPHFDNVFVLILPALETERKCRQFADRISDFIESECKRRGVSVRGLGGIFYSDEMEISFAIDEVNP